MSSNGAKTTRFSTSSSNNLIKVEGEHSEVISSGINSSEENSPLIHINNHVPKNSANKFKTHGASASNTLLYPKSRLSNI